MQSSNYIRPPHWVEPAHPGVIKIRDDLVSVLTAVRAKVQPAFDDAFDRISRQIGFVVTTTLPVAFEVDAKSQIARVSLSAGNLQGTLFEQGFAESFKSLAKLKVGNEKDPVAAGSYHTYVIWLAALKLRLRYDWLEPAHWGSVDLSRFITTAAESVFDYSPIEPAQWFDPGLAISALEGVSLSALDEVYPELQLVERLGQIRAQQRITVGPGVREPAHPRLNCDMR
jgi:hypothetical protein